MANLNEQLEFLKASTEARIKNINNRRFYYRRKSFLTYISTAALAALTTVLLGMQVEGKLAENIRMASLIITTVITLINTYSAFFNHKELWVANNTALNKFYELKFNMEYQEKGGQLTSEIIDHFKKTYQAILDDLNQTWLKSRTETQQDT